MSAPATPADPAPTVKRPQVAWTDGMEDLVRRVVAEHPKMTRQQQVDEFNKLNVGGQVVSFTSFTGKIATLRLGNRRRGVTSSGPSSSTDQLPPSSQESAPIGALLEEAEVDKKPEIEVEAVETAAQPAAPADPAEPATTAGSQTRHPAAETDVAPATLAAPFVPPPPAASAATPAPRPRPSTRKGSADLEAELERLMEERVEAAREREKVLSELIGVKKRRLERDHGGGRG